MNYFAVECENGNCRDHIIIIDNDGNRVFENYLNMTYDEMREQEDLDEFVIAIIDATTDGDDCVILTLVGDDDVFIWSILAGIINGEIRYDLVNWQKDNKKYRYEPIDK